MKKMSRLFLGFTKLTGYLPAWLLFKPKVYFMNASCRRRLPKPCILMSNHCSLLDFVLYLTLFPFYALYFLMAEVLFKKGKMFSWFLYKMGGIRVDRDACDFRFVGECLEILDRGGRVCIFPQGRLPVNGKPFPFKPGIVLVALRTEAPIVPIYTDGNYGLFKRAHVMIGEAIDLHNCCNHENATEAELQMLCSVLEEKTYQLKKELEKRLKA